MIKEKYITVGIVGHVGHGKTALVRCLTGMGTDRLQEEKQCNPSIVSCVVPLKRHHGPHIALVDVPGQADFLKNTIRGLSAVDMAILVVAADDGVMPQTQEHLKILNFFNIKWGFIVLSKTDKVDVETLELAEHEIRKTVMGTFLEGKPVVPFSVIDQRGIGEIRQNIEKQEEKITGKGINAPFRLCIDQVRSFTGFGTVVTGTIFSGTIKQNDLIHLMPSGKKARARFLEVHNRKVSIAFAGQRVGINLSKVPVKDVKRGMVISKPGALSPTYLLNGELRALQRMPKPIKNRQRVRLYLGTSVINALTVIMEKEQLEPGETGLVQFRLMRPVVALPRDHFVICRLNVKSIIGGGTVLEIPREKYRQSRASDMLPYLKSLQRHDLTTAIGHLFKNNKTHLITIDDLARKIGFPAEEIEIRIRAKVEEGEVLDFNDGVFFGRTSYQTLKRQLAEIIKKNLLRDPLKMTVNAEEIRNRIKPSIDEALLHRILAELCKEGKVSRTNGGFNIRNLSTRLSKEQENLIDLLLDYARNSGLAPFSAATFWKFHKRKHNINEIQRLLDYLHAQKRLIRLNNRRFLSPQAIDRIKEMVEQAISEKGRLTIADSKEVLGYGRTVGVAVLEYLDTIGLTIRHGNERFLRKQETDRTKNDNALQNYQDTSL